MSNAGRGSDDDYCSAYPVEGHFYISHSVDAAPIRWIEVCQFCSHINNAAIRRALVPNRTGWVEISARSGSLAIEHAPDCLCWRGGDGKTIDSRCIAAYRVPLAIVGAAEPSDAPSGEGEPVPQPEKTQETICDEHKQQYFQSGYEAGKRDALTSTADTMMKVRRALDKSFPGSARQRLTDAIAALQNEGILFREHPTESPRRGRLITLQEFD